MPVQALSAPNIALIKYWGNRDEKLRLPAADSLSMVLDTPTARTTVETADVFSVKNPPSEKAAERLKQHFVLVQQYLKDIGRNIPAAVSILIESTIPPAIGLASSAAVFSALAEAYAAFVTDKPLRREEVSILARLGSGSAARSVLGGYVALGNHGEGIGSAYANQIADENHWELHDIIIVPSKEEKKVGSTEGHAKASTSPLFAARLKEIPRRMKECTDAIKAKDFEKLRIVSEEDALEMHRVMETQSPSLHYLSEETHRIIREVEKLRTSEKLDVLFTMDAGPTVHLICTDEARSTVQAFAEAQKGCIVFKTKTGQGSHTKPVN